MENKQPKRRWKIPVLLVSAICILLASSFVFHTTAEASVLTYSLQGATFTMPMENDGTLAGAGIDRSLISDYTISSSNQYVLNDSYDTTGLVSVSKSPVAFFQMPDCMYATKNGSTVTLYKVNGQVQIEISSSATYPCFISGYIFCRISNYECAIYSYDQQLIKIFSMNNSTPIGFFFFDSRYYIVYSHSSGANVIVLDEAFNQIYTYTIFSGTNYYYYRSCSYGSYIYIATPSGIVSFDMVSHSTVSYFDTGVDYSYAGLCHDGTFLYVFQRGEGYFCRVDLSTQSSLIFDYSISVATPNNTTGVFASICLDSIFVYSNNFGLKLSKSDSYYYDFGVYAENYIQNAKYVNFSVESSASVNGGDVVGIKLDYNLSPEYLSTLGTYGLRLTGCTMLASIDDPSAVPVNFGYGPIVVKVNGTVVPRYSTSYDLIGEYNGLYLYSFISSVDFQGYNKISSLEIYLNCYIPEQLSKHSFSLPVSPIELYLDPAGGGGGGSSDASSGGNETGAPSEIPPESVFYEDTLYIYKKLPDGGFGWVTDWNIKDYKTISVFTGYAPSVALSGYINSQFEQYVGTIRITYQDGRKAYIETDGTGIVGYGSSENSMVYPFSLGGWVDVEISENNYLYIDQNMPENILVVGSGDTNYLQLNMRSDADLVFVRANDEDTDIGWVSGNGETGELTVRQKIWQLQKYGNVSGYYDTHYFSAGQFFSFHRYDFPPATTGGVFNGFCFLNLYFYTGDKSPLEVSIEYSIYLEEQSRIAAEESYLNYLAGLAYGDMNFDADYSDGFGDAFDIQDGLYDVPAGAMITGTWDSLWDSHPFAFAMISTVIVFAIVKFIINKV